MTPTPSLRRARGITPYGGDGDDEHPSHANACRSRASPPASTRAFSKGCSRCVRVRALGERRGEGGGGKGGGLTRGLPNSAPRRLITPGCGASITTTHPSWSLKSMLIRFAYGSAALGPANLGRRSRHCALGEATRGHNAATALIHAAAQS